MAGVAEDGPASEKKSIHASEQDSEEGRRRRQAWREQVASIDARRLVFVDESGATTETTRRYGRALGGQRVQEATPAGHWRTLTVLGAMSADGLIAAMTIEAPTDRDVFLGCLEQVLCPSLKPGQIVVMDNLSSHKVAGVRDPIQAAGAELLYLPPLLAGLQSHRKMLGETQTEAPFAQGQDVRCAGNGSRQSDPRHLSKKRPGLVQALSLWSTASRNMI